MLVTACSSTPTTRPSHVTTGPAKPSSSPRTRYERPLWADATACSTRAWPLSADDVVLTGGVVRDAPPQPASVMAATRTAVAPST